MPPSGAPGRHIEILFAEADCTMELDIDDEDPADVHVIVAAMETDDPDQAEVLLRTALGARGQVNRRA
jgi:hypothetical protein